MSRILILRLYHQDQLVEVKQFTALPIMIGNQAQVQFQVNDPAVSPLHAMIEVRGERIVLVDLGSESGVIVNGQRILEHDLHNGAEFQLGEHRMQVMDPTAAATQAVPTPQPPSPPPPMPERRELPQTQAPQTKADQVQSPKAQTVPSETQATEPEQVEIQEPEAQEAEATKAAEPMEPTEPTEPSSGPDLAPSSMVESPTPAGLNRRPSQPPTNKRPEHQPGKGPHLEVITLWGDSIVASRVYRGKKRITIGGSEAADILIPGFAQAKIPFVQFSGSIVAALRPEMMSQYTFASGETQRTSDVLGRLSVQQKGQNQLIEVRQGEMLRVEFAAQNMSVLLRYASDVPVAPFAGLPLSGPGVFGVAAALVSVFLLMFFVQLNTPVDVEEPEDEVQLVAKLVYDKKPVLKKAPPVSKVEPELKKKKPKPKPKPPKKKPERVKKVDLTKKNKVKAKKKSDKQQRRKAPNNGSGGAAGATAGKRKGAKGFTSVKRGGAKNLQGRKEGSSAAEKRKDVSKAGMFSAFGGKGVRSNLDKGSVGPGGGLIGRASQATGASGSTSDIEGDIGTSTKDVGALGGGNRLQGIAGVKTKGRGTGYTGEGTGGDLGDKKSFLVFPEGGDEEFVGVIDREGVLRVIKAGKREIRSCYERELNYDPSIGGSVTLTWDIGAGGRVVASKVLTSDIKSQRMLKCMRDRLESWKFPEPVEGKIVPVEYKWILDRL